MPISRLYFSDIIMAGKFRWRVCETFLKKPLHLYLYYFIFSDHNITFTKTLSFSSFTTGVNPTMMVKLAFDKTKYTYCKAIIGNIIITIELIEVTRPSILTVTHKNLRECHSVSSLITRYKSYLGHVFADWSPFKQSSCVEIDGVC